MRFAISCVTLSTLAVTGGAAIPAGTWTRVADMQTARSAHAVVATTQGIYVFAGTGPDGTPVTSVERFDGKTWSPETALPGEGLNAPAAAAIGDVIYLLGGFGSTTNRPTTAVQMYDTARKTWSAGPSLPAPRGGHAAAVLNGHIHVFGGGNSVSTIDDHSVLDPKAGTWAARAPLPRRMGSPAAVAMNGRLFSIGGRSGPNDFGDVYVYDPTADRWSPGPSIPARGTSGAGAIGDAIYLVGGESQADQKVLGDVLRLPRGATAWATDGTMPVPRNYARVVIFQGALYVVGGSTEYGASHSSRGSTVVERYDPSSRRR